jgi:hypothetical protein
MSSDQWLHQTYEDWCEKEYPNYEKDDDSILVNTKAHNAVFNHPEEDVRLYTNIYSDKIITSGK